MHEGSAMKMSEFLKKLPKAELHVHLEGTLEPELLLKLAERNKVKLPYQSLDDVVRAYQFPEYEAFRTAFIIGTSVVKTEQDFYDITKAYLAKVADQGVLHAELFFDTQTYTPRGIKVGTIINGIHAGIQDAHKELGITCFMMLCFLRHLSEEDAFQSLESSLPYKDKIIGVGLASTEKGNPPSKFKHVFARAREYGFHCVAHVGENAGPAYIYEALEVLQLERIDHGIRCMEDPALVALLVKKKIPLTVCPSSNVALKVFPTLAHHPLKAMIEAGLLVSINSDDPSYFGQQYIGDVYESVARELKLSVEQLITCARNSFSSSFLDEDRKQACLRTLEYYVKNNECT